MSADRAHNATDELLAGVTMLAEATHRRWSSLTTDAA
jgi:hypothetical protein